MPENFDPITLGAIVAHKLLPFDIEVASGYTYHTKFARFNIICSKRRIGWRKITGVMAENADEALELYKQGKSFTRGSVRAIPWKPQSKHDRGNS